MRPRCYRGWWLDWRFESRTDVRAVAQEGSTGRLRLRPGEAVSSVRRNLVTGAVRASVNWEAGVLTVRTAYPTPEVSIEGGVHWRTPGAVWTMGGRARLPPGTTIEGTGLADILAKIDAFWAHRAADGWVPP